MTSRSAPITIETTQTLDTMLHQVLNQALVAIDAKAGSLMLVAARQGILQIKARLGPPRPGRVTERVFSVDDNSIAGLVVRRKRSYLCHDVDHDAFFLRSRSGRNFTSLLSVPIVHDGRVIAVINADSERRRRFNDDDRRLLESVAQKVAGPIADRISITDALAEVGVELTRLPREGGVDRVLDKISDLAVRSLGADVVTLYQYDEETDEFPVEGIGPAIGGTIRDRRAMRRKISPGDVPWTVVKERRPGFYVNVHEEEFLVGQANRPGRRPQPRFVEREGIKSMAALLLPFRAAESEDEEVVGVMFANYKTRHTFNIDEMSALKTFADYASVAILNARYEERRRTDQIRMVESISANLAHRMSNLAGPSRPAVELLRERVDPADELAHRQLDTIERKADLLMDLASQLVRRIKEAGSIVEIEPVPLEPLIGDELSRIDSDRGRVVLHRDVPPGLPRVQTIEYQLRQVLGDLLDNAVAAVADLPRGDISVTARRNDLTKRVEIEVSDNGAGIPDEIRNGLFTAGVSTKRDTLGIGLWYGRAFLQATGGDLRLASTGPGEGTTFLIEVPVAKEERRGKAGGTPTSPRPEILIVENEADWRSAMTDALAGQGYRLTVATTYAEAAALLASTPFALAILDLSLHDDPHNRDGLDLLEHIDGLRLETRVVIVTGHGDEDDRQVARRSPRFVEMVHKDGFSVSAFRALVDRFVRGGGTPAAGGRPGMRR